MERCIYQGSLCQRRDQQDFVVKTRCNGRHYPLCPVYQDITENLIKFYHENHDIEEVINEEETLW